MTDLSAEYLGLKLRTPVIASSSPLTATPDKIAELADHGIGGVVLKSIFEEQIAGETAMLSRYHDHPDADDYLHAYIGSDYMRGFIELISESKKRTGLPIIASINCAEKGKWIEYARKITDAGADALELNIFFLPSGAGQTSSEIEARYFDIVGTVVKSIGIPVSVKLSMRFTNIIHIAQEIYNRGAKGAVLYNRFFEPDIDIENMEYVPADGLSARSELYKSLRYIAIASAAVPGLDLSASTGVHTGEDAIKAILAGARSVQLCSTIMIHGMNVIGEINAFIENWMQRNSFSRIDDFRGLMNRKVRVDPLLDRVQYMKMFPPEM